MMGSAGNDSSILSRSVWLVSSTGIGLAFMVRLAVSALLSTVFRGVASCISACSVAWFQEARLT
jgi:hypothetical protein